VDPGIITKVEKDLIGLKLIEKSISSHGRKIELITGS